MLTSLAGGSAFNFAGDVDATLMQISGSGLADTFNIRPDQDVGDVLTPSASTAKPPRLRRETI